MSRSASILGLFGCLTLALGCNLLTGADDITLGDGEGAESAGSSSESGSGSNAGPTSGPSTGTQAGPTTGPGVGPTVGPSSGSESGSTGSGQVSCDYPAGPYGKQAGLVLDPNFVVEAYLEGSSAPSMVTGQDLFDCQGQDGTKALLITTSSLT